MNRAIPTFFVTALLLGGGLPALAQVSAPEAREAALAKADRFEALPVGALSERFARVSDPFHALEGVERVARRSPAGGAAENAAPVSDRVILRELAEKIRPTGVMHFGENTLLLFGERRVSVGDFLSVPHNGRQYRVELIKADSRTFTIRLNNELISKRIQ